MSHRYAASSPALGKTESEIVHGTRPNQSGKVWRCRGCLAVATSTMKESSSEVTILCSLEPFGIILVLGQLWNLFKHPLLPAHVFDKTQSRNAKGIVITLGIREATVFKTLKSLSQPRPCGTHRLRHMHTSARVAHAITCSRTRTECTRRV